MSNVAVLVILFVAVLVSQIAKSAESDKRRTFAELGLTALGAEKAGNMEGTIPAWNKSEVLSQQRLDEIANEKPLFYITQENLNEHRTHLSVGVQALINKYPDTFKVPVYNSYRTHHVPDYIYQATAKNYLSAELIDEGNGIKNVWQGVPFPVPENAQQVLWNHLVSWRGVHIKVNYTEVLVQENGSFQEIVSRGEVASPYNAPDRDIFADRHVKTYYLTRTLSPANLAGGGLLIYDTLNQRLNPRKVWFYDAQQRRVIRIPDLGHDTPNPNSEMVRVVDEVDLFNGLPERYHWKLLGKKELYIPYNNNRLINMDIDQLTQKHHIDLTNARFELHRVWVVEGVLKEDHRHIYGRRRMYIDEDSWITMHAEQYDKHDALWRVSLSYTKFYPEMPGIWKVVDTYHDLKTSQHFSQLVKGGADNKVEFSNELPSKRHFSPGALRQSSRR
ncbi:DUF1329 domain-containing protein [Alkalimarinus sediminis]|uniref:DUF1329 domain-containing protein n=1 Tax=Alkalimarinus sediminis TaxID=1632866 RepID=A0A9E8HLX6_9ALTE|nr:DUF1329 domain-containing protein [Alkalimarinus sediminis]UZW76720.1 DUF1329 domain-containing protein [Alkalimarinus sediminis]